MILSLLLQCHLMTRKELLIRYLGFSIINEMAEAVKEKRRTIIEEIRTYDDEIRTLNESIESVIDKIKHFEKVSKNKDAEKIKILKEKLLQLNEKQKKTKGSYICYKG